jgi:hypothetical protein
MGQKSLSSGSKKVRLPLRILGKKRKATNIISQNFGLTIANRQQITKVRLAGMEDTQRRAAEAIPMEEIVAKVPLV